MNRNDTIKVLKIVSLGVAIWGLSLVWPDLNRGLTPWVKTRLGLGLGLINLTYLLGQYLNQSRQIIAPVEVTLPTRPWLSFDYEDKRS